MYYILSVLFLLILIAFYLVIRHAIVLFYLKRLDKKSVNVVPPKYSNVFRTGFFARIFRIVFVGLEKRLSEKEIFKDIFNTLSNLFKNDSWSILLTPREKDWTFFVWSYNLDKGPLDELAKCLQKNVPSNIKKVFESKLPFLIEDVSNFSEWLEVKNLSVKSWVGIPILINNEVYGIINLDWKRKKRFRRRHIEFFKIVSEEISMIISYILNVKELILEANTDILTGIFNRRKLEEKGIEEYKEFIFLDLNGFKRVNDTFGHEVGDEVLKIVANRLKNSLKSEDLCIRYGGDEFVIALKTADDKLHPIIERLRKKVEAPIKIGDKVIEISVSIGVAKREAGSSILETIKKADENMYKDKNKN
ncbi:MAG: sensor domain-containing diguanylate cyclase [Thermosipho sp. (in: Bacteria)]|nr:sensor domain-containing diguanylate cyclase [Thermosipho sp. (in: thermotogales)]